MRRDLSAAAVALAIAALCGPAAADAALSAPVIHEGFTPLPCVHNHSTQDDEGCAEQAIIKSDKHIDSLNATIFGRLADTPSRRDFVAGHKAWLSFRKAYCLSVSDVFRGGTEAAVLDAQCISAVNDEHVTDLKRLASDLKPG